MAKSRYDNSDMVTATNINKLSKNPKVKRIKKQTISKHPNLKDSLTASTNSIFISQSEMNHYNGVAEKISYTNVLETIPEGSFPHRVLNWRKMKKIEWRWRFLELPNGKFTVEISRLSYDEDKRLYFNKYGRWVYRDVDPIYDQYVKKECYCYSDD